MSDFKENDGIEKFVAILQLFDGVPNHDLLTWCCYTVGIPVDREDEFNRNYWEDLSELLHKRLLILVNKEDVEEQFLIMGLVNWIIARYFEQTDVEISRLSLNFEKLVLEEVDQKLQMPPELRTETDEFLHRRKRNTEKRISEWPQRIEEKKVTLNHFRETASLAFPRQYWDFYNSWKARTR